MESVTAYSLSLPRTDYLEELVRTETSHVIPRPRNGSDSLEG